MQVGPGAARCPNVEGTTPTGNALRGFSGEESGPARLLPVVPAGVPLAGTRGSLYNDDDIPIFPCDERALTMQKTLALLKPDAVHRHLVGEILRRFEHKGLRIVAMKILHASRELAAKHY